ncbi:MAG: replication initiator, partial [Nocardioidaceae bacterium]
MFLTLTLPSYGRVRDDGTPVDPEGYDYRGAAVDALHFPKLMDRFWQNLRRAAGYQVQYFAAVEPQRRLSPHLHAAVRGTMPRETLRQVVAATYKHLWWPSFDEPVYVDTLPVWLDGAGYVDPDSGEVLPTWDEALDALDEQDAGPAHVLRFGSQLDMAGLLAGSEDANKAVGYLCKYLTKSVADTYDGETPKPAHRRHLERLHAETRWLPCTPECPNRLRFGVQPNDAEEGMTPGQCPSKAHAPDTLGLGGRRVLVSRYWTGKTLTDHKADRATIVKTVLEEAGYDAPDVDRCSATALGSDGMPRFVWSPVRPEDSDMLSYRALLIES